MIDGTKYVWAQYVTTGSTMSGLVVHPTTGWTGEYYNTALQPIGSYHFVQDDALLPIENGLYLIFEIPNTAYGEIIDGKTFNMTLPYYEGTPVSYVNEKVGYYSYGAALPEEIELYGTYNKSNLSVLNLDRVNSEKDYSMKDIGARPDLEETDYESNVVLLFCDNILEPQGSNLTSWSSGYSDVIDGTRVFNPLSVEKATYDHVLDKCIGFVALDKGFVVITHPKIVDSYFRKIFNGTVNLSNPTDLFNITKTYDVNGTYSTNTARGYVYTDSSEMITTLNSNSEVVWDSTQFVFHGIPTATGISSDMQYISYNTEKTLNIVCLASSDEFYKSTNDTARELLDTDATEDYSNFKSEDQNLYPVMITGLNLHDANGDVLAICKPVQPQMKYWYDVTSFNVKIRL
jgi:hypothetical protein